MPNGGIHSASSNSVGLHKSVDTEYMDHSQNSLTLDMFCRNVGWPQRQLYEFPRFQVVLGM